MADKDVTDKTEWKLIISVLFECFCAYQFPIPLIEDDTFEVECPECRNWYYAKRTGNTITVWEVDG